MKTILITTSGIGERLGEITKYTNKSLVKVGDKLAICHIIELYNSIDVEFIITLGYLGNYVKDFLTLAYPDKKFIFVEVDLFVGKGSSLGYSMLKAKEYLQKPFIFHCCDAIVLDKINLEENKNILYVSEYKNSDSYTNIKCKNNLISELNLKKHKDYDYVYTGLASIFDYQLFWKYLEEIYNGDINNTSLSDVNAIQYMLKENILFEYNVLTKWYDTGNIESYNQIRKEIKSNYNVIEKNNESICFFDDKVIKFINDKEINKKRVLRGEYLYPFSPKILNSSENFVVMELIKGNILSEVYQHNIIYELLNWANKNLWIKKNTNIEYINCCKNFYIQKTLDRLSKLHFLNSEKNIINGIKCSNVYDFIKYLPENLIINDTFVKFHGDFILDNIIKTDNSFKLIDWRHEFDTQLEYGDIYYDLAKLRHNIIFNHSNILNELFTIEYNNNEVIVDLKCNYFLINQLNDFEKFVNENNYDLKKIKLITSIIWLNMSPLYTGKLSEFLFYFGKYNLFINY
jgi:NDP-sugar pyrophosphorylase family protein